jgi:beta-galactosidase
LAAFKAGTLRAEGFINGKKVASNSVKTPETASKIELSYDLSSKKINPEFPDVIFVYAKITDANGTVIPTATDEVTFALSEGNAEIIGQNPVKAEAGIATIILKTQNLKKKFSIKATTQK